MSQIMPDHPPFSLIPPERAQVRHNATLMEAIRFIDASEARIALVIADDGRMIGSLTDGDIRRALIAGCTLESPVSKAMHANPSVMAASSSRQDIIHGMRQAQVKQMPLLNPDGTVHGIATYDALTGFLKVTRDNDVVIMAGGRGQRLLPITADIPKPMIDLAGKPILEHILNQFTQQGFHRFTLAINYLGHMIESYFGDGAKFNCEIRYLHEREFLGTAGALSLLKHRPTSSMLVINGDILTSVNFGELMDYHQHSSAIATVCARHHRTEVPYGVIRMNQGRLETIIEKPTHEDLISAGIYALHPDALDFIPQGQPADMPGVLMALAQSGRHVAVYPLREDWLDIGRHDDLERIRLQMNGQP